MPAADGLSAKPVNVDSTPVAIGGPAAQRVEMRKGDQRSAGAERTREVTWAACGERPRFREAWKERTESWNETPALSESAGRATTESIHRVPARHGSPSLAHRSDDHFDHAVERAHRRVGVEVDRARLSGLGRAASDTFCHSLTTRIAVARPLARLAGNMPYLESRRVTCTFLRLGHLGGDSYSSSASQRLRSTRKPSSVEMM